MKFSHLHKACLLLNCCLASPFLRGFANAEPTQSLEVDGEARGRYLRYATSRVKCTVYLIDYFSLSILEGGNQDIPSTYSCIDHDNEDKEYELTYAGNSEEDAIVNSPIFNGEAPESGETTIRVAPRSVVDKYKIDLSVKSEKVKVLANRSADPSPHRSRRLGQRRSGESSVAVFRINSLDGEPNKSAAELADDIFGIGSDKYNLVSGYRTISGNKLTFYPGEGNGLVDGVLDLTLDQATAGVDKNVVDRWVWERLGSNGINFPLNSYDHYMYVMPENVEFGRAAAYACLWCPKTVYLNYQASNYQVLLHEFGHNLGHVHSGKDGGSYNDRTCWMGAHTYWDEGPAACFNAPKSWYFGWYSDRHIQVAPTTESASLKLAGIDDYLNDQTVEGEHYVILRLKESNEDLYIMYNRAKGINSGVRGSADLVTVVEQRGDRRQSWQLAELDAGETYTKANWNGSGDNLIVSVCNLVPGVPDHANVVVHLESDDSVSCDGFTFTPTSAPTPTPANIHTSYYDVTLNRLPDEGLSSLTPYDTEYVENIDFRPGSGTFAGSGRENGVAALFEGYLQFPFPDTYYMCLTSDDGSKLFIDDELFLDNDGTHGSVRVCDVYDGAGVSKFELEYFENGGGATLYLEWVPLTRPPEFRLMTVVHPSAFVRKPGNTTNSPTKSPTTSSPTASPSAAPMVVVTQHPSSIPTDSPSATPTNAPSFKPSASISSSPTAPSSGGLRVKYYVTGVWTALPPDGLSTLSSYKSEMVETINFPYTTGNFAGSGRRDYVAALYEGTIQLSLPTSSWTLEAEDAAVLSSQVEIDNIHSGSSGTAFVDYLGSGSGAYIQWELPIDAQGAGFYDLKFRYALGRSESRPLEVSTNGVDEIVDFPSTGRWSNWVYTEPITVSLNAGSNYIRASAIGSSGANIDHLLVEAASASNTVGFCITSDDGSKLFVNGEMIIDNDGLHGNVRKCGSAEITDGQIDVVVEFFERGGGATLILEWSPPGATGYSVVPAEAWI